MDLVAEGATASHDPDLLFAKTQFLRSLTGLFAKFGWSFYANLRGCYVKN